MPVWRVHFYSSYKVNWVGLETSERVYDSISEPVALEKSEQKLFFMTQDRK